MLSQADYHSGCHALKCISVDRRTKGEGDYDKEGHGFLPSMFKELGLFMKERRQLKEHVLFPDIFRVSYRTEDFSL